MFPRLCCVDDMGGPRLRAEDSTASRATGAKNVIGGKMDNPATEKTGDPQETPGTASGDQAGAGGRGGWDLHTGRARKASQKLDHLHPYLTQHNTETRVGGGQRGTVVFFRRQVKKRDGTRADGAHPPDEGNRYQQKQCGFRRVCTVVGVTLRGRGLRASGLTRTASEGPGSLSVGIVDDPCRTRSGPTHTARELRRGEGKPEAEADISWDMPTEGVL